MAMDAERQAIRSIEILCKLFGLHRERRWVVDAARRHPTFPSLESMAHAFSVRGLEAVALRCGYEDLRDMPLPSLVVVRGRREPLFCVVDSVDSEQVHFALSPDGGAGLAKAEAFQALWEGAVMVFNREGYTLMPHPDGGVHRMVRGVRRGVWGVLSILFVLGLFWVLTDAQSFPDWDWKSMTLTLLPFVGFWLSGLLIVASFMTSLKKGRLSSSNTIHIWSYVGSLSSVSCTICTSCSAGQKRTSFSRWFENRACHAFLAWQASCFERAHTIKCYLCR